GRALPLLLPPGARPARALLPRAPSGRGERPARDRDAEGRARGDGSGRLPAALGGVRGPAALPAALALRRHSRRAHPQPPCALSLSARSLPADLTPRPPSPSLLSLIVLPSLIGEREGETPSGSPLSLVRSHRH